MKVTGFSFIRNAVKLQYPIAEALRSILPLCDEIIVAVGRSDDGTRELVAGIDPKIRIIDTVWDDTLKEGGKVLAVETEKAFRAIDDTADWCIYIQGDEVMHEDGYAEVSAAMKKWKDDPRVDGLLFKYRHFFGSYDYIGIEGNWYRNEIRVIRNSKSIYSYRDAQGFRKGDNEKLQVKSLNAYIHHYGWVQDPRTMRAKFMVKEKINLGMENDENNIVVPDNYHELLVKALGKYTGSHPKLMEERMRNIGWAFNYDVSKNTFRLKDRFKNLVEKITGKRPFTYRNYKVI